MSCLRSCVAACEGGHRARLHAAVTQTEGMRGNDFIARGKYSVQYMMLVLGDLQPHRASRSLDRLELLLLVLQLIQEDRLCRMQREGDRLQIAVQRGLEYCQCATATRPTAAVAHPRELSADVQDVADAAGALRVPPVPRNGTALLVLGWHRDRGVRRGRGEAMRHVDAGLDHRDYGQNADLGDLGRKRCLQLAGEITVEVEAAAVVVAALVLRDSERPQQTPTIGTHPLEPQAVRVRFQICLCGGRTEVTESLLKTPLVRLGVVPAAAKNAEHIRADDRELVKLEVRAL